MQRSWILTIFWLACGSVASAQHVGVITSLAINGENTLVLTGSSDKTAILWDARGKKLRVLEGHTANVSGVALSNDGGSIALTGARDRTAIVWDAATGKKLHILKGHTDVITGVALSRDGQFALTGSEDKTAILWNTADGRKRHTLDGHSGKVMAVSLSDDGAFALTGALDKTACLWDATGKKLRTFASKSDLYGVALSGNGKVAFLGGVHDRTIWDATTGKQLHTFHVASGYSNVALSGDGKLALTPHYNTIAGLWDTKDGKVIRSFENRSFETKQTMLGVALSRDGKFALTSSFDTTASLWDTATGNKLQTFPGGGSSAPQGPLQLMVGDHAPIHSLGLSEDGKTLLVGYGWGAAIWDLSQAKLRHLLDRNKRDFGAGVAAAALSGDGKLAITADDRSATLWDAATGKKRFQLVGHKDYVRAVALSPRNIEAQAGSPWALTGSQDGTSILWDAATGKKIQTFTGKDIVVRVALHDNFSLLTGTVQGGAGIWGVASGRAMRGFSHKGAVTGLAQGFDKRNAFVISAGDTRAVMWSKIDGKIIKTFPHRTEVTCLALSTDLKHLVTGARDGIAYMKNLSNGKPIQSFNHGEFLQFPGEKMGRFVLRPGGDVTAVALTSDGKHLWSSISGGAVFLWDVKSGKNLCRLYCGAGDSAHWLVTTTDGHFDGSPNAWKHVSYRVQGSRTILDDDATRKTMHRPGLLAKILEDAN